MNNRLKLNFQLETAEERKKFLTEYLEREEFRLNPPTPEELEMCGNYILWGKDKDGKNCVQRKEIEIETKNKTWNKKEEESLDGLLESPSFNENQILGQNSIKTKIPREVFDRKKALSQAPPAIKEEFLRLFHQIDEYDLIINFYDLAHGKRKNPPRAELLKNFTEEEQNRLKQKSKTLNQYSYLKLRHFLVDLRRQQFSLKDSYSSIIQRHTFPELTFSQDKPSFDTDIPVFPLGVKNEKKLSKLIFRDEYDPKSYSKEELSMVSDFLWDRKTNKFNYNFIFDFQNMEHVYHLFLLYFELEDEIFKKELESETNSLLSTLQFYINRADLTEIQKEILHLKINKVKNQDIIKIINGKYNKSYTANYISTIFKQKIIKQINNAAAIHEEIIENIFFPENFKRCNSCGKILLCDSNNFVKKTRSKDGFSNRCKKCDKEERMKKRGK